MPEREPWTMPEWMEPYRRLISNTGGNPIEELLNDHDSHVGNHPMRAALIVAVHSQVGLLRALRREGLLVDPPASVPVEGGEREEIIDRLAGIEYDREACAALGADAPLWHDASAAARAPYVARIERMAIALGVYRLDAAGDRLYRALALVDKRDGSDLAHVIRSAREGWERSDMDEPGAFDEFDARIERFEPGDAPPVPVEGDARAVVVSALSGYDVEVGGVKVVRGTNSMSAHEAAQAIDAANGLPPAAPVETGDAERHPIDKETRRALFDAQAALMQAAIDMPAGPRRGRAQRASRRMSDFISERRVLTDALAAAQARRAAVPSPVDGEREGGGDA